MGQIGFSAAVGSEAAADEEDVVAGTEALGFDSAITIGEELFSKECL
jgi:hypothetical protein